jgi:alkylation response protein AidB-like acyl-CoA dehydrogenase
MTAAVTAAAEERQALREAVRALLSRRSDSAAVRAAAESPSGYDVALWNTLCEQIGVAGLALPERYGGAGASLAETCVVAEELGRLLTPAPLLGSAVLAGHAVLAARAGDQDPVATELLTAVAEGRIAALVLAGADGRWDPDAPACTAEHGPRGWQLTGAGQHVLDGDLAEYLVVAARTPDGVGLFRVDPAAESVRRRHTPSMDPTRRLAVVELTAAPGDRIGGAAGPALREALAAACAVLAAEQVGAAARCLELTVAYTASRVQFGRPIGGFQALKHRMADLHVLVETARSAALAAAEDGPDRTTRAAVAKVWCSEAFHTVAAETIQLHGGIAITWEHDAQLYFKRAHGSAQLFGAPAEYVARLAGFALAQ